MLRRDAAHVQVGPVVLEDRQGVVDLLRHLDHASDTDRPLLDRLERAGAVVDTIGWPGGIPRSELNHAALVGADPRRLAGRRRICVAVVGRADITQPLEDLLVRSGVRVDGEPTTQVVIHVGEPPRTAFDPLVAAGIAHLPVVLDDTTVRVGPFVVPGRTPCLRCHDRSRAEWDSSWPALVSQFGHSRIREIAVDAVGLHLVFGFIAQEVHAHAEGRRPESAGQRITLHDADRSVEPVRFDPGCACHFPAL